MDMDFPDPQELEWLEANNSNLQDDFDIELDALQPPSPPSEPEPPESPEPKELNLEPKNPPSKPTFSLAPIPPSIKPQLPVNPKKRQRPYVGSHLSESGSFDHVVEDKRSRVNTINCGKVGGIGSVDDDDEDWLRFSPPSESQEADVTKVVEEKVLSRYAMEIKGDFVPVTGLDGERVYAKIRGVEKEEREKKSDIKRNSEGLTLEPIRVLMQRVEDDGFSKALQASVGGESDVNYSEAPVNQEQLWVDKYAPNSFTELLSDEQTNREVLLWLKQWDSCVFGSEIKSTEDDVLSALKRHSLGVQQSKFSSRNSFRNNRETMYSKETHGVRNCQNQENKNQEINNSKDIQELWEKKRRQSGPPEQKILLLCGPPGLGKTTLAHVAARHCGYRVVEINASDDRSSSTIEAKILDVVQMNSVIADSKPKCLVIDEIDGALGDGKGAVDVILKMVSAEKRSDIGKENIAQEEHSGRKSLKKKQRNTSLLRPVICICNDLYAPALRPLRQVAKVHIFVQPTVNRVVNRLKCICNKEGVRASSIALTALTEYTECDIRSCLNTLQFLSKKKEALNMLDISSQVVGRKDASKSALDIWKEIFQKRKVKRERKFINTSHNMSNEFEFLLSLISNRGDYDLILDGIHENILSLQYYDPVMQKTVKCLDNLEVSDIIHKYILCTQQMSLKVYQPPIAIGIHGLVAQIDRPIIEWPKFFQRYRTTSEKLETLHSWHNRIHPYISRHLSPASFVEESISPFLHILSPPTMKPVALHLLSEKEKNEFARLVNTMVSYAITYKNLKSGPSPGIQRHEDLLDASLLSFDPPIDDFVNFKGYTSCHFVLTSAVKQVLVHEVEKQRILQSSSNWCTSSADACNKENYAFLGMENSISQSFRSCHTTASAEKQVSADNLSKQGKQTLSLSRPSNSEPAKGATTNGKVRSPEKRKKPSGGSSFFDRFRKVRNNGPQNMNNDIQKPGTLERDMRPLLFKFNEGFTNAVKRPVRIREFLL